MKFKCKCGNTLEILEENFKKNYPICNKCGGKFIFYCNSCKIYLYGKPKIFYEKSIYCYSCAKRIINSKKEIVDKGNEKLRIEYDKLFSEWIKKRKGIGYEETNWIIPTGATIAAILPVLFLGLIGIGIAIFLEGIVVPILFIVRSKIISKRQQEYSFINPPPKIPNYKSLDYFLLPHDGFSYKTKNYRLETIKRDNAICQNCNRIFDQSEIEVHHIIPKAQNGDDYPSNLITLCFQCHVNENWFGHRHYYR